MISPEKRIKDIAMFMIVISGLFLLASLAAWGSGRPLIGEMAQFMDVMNRKVLPLCGIIGIAAGVGLLFRWNVARMLMVCVCALTCGFALLVLIGMLLMPLGTGAGESKTSLLILKIVCLLFIAAPVLIPIAWMKFLTVMPTSRCMTARTSVDLAYEQRPNARTRGNILVYSLVSRYHSAA